MNSLRSRISFSTSIQILWLESFFFVAGWASLTTRFNLPEMRLTISYKQNLNWNHLVIISQLIVVCATREESADFAPANNLMPDAKNQFSP